MYVCICMYTFKCICTALFICKHSCGYVYEYYVFFINKCIIKKITNFIYHIVMLNTETHNLSSNIRF
nr:hypothetical protein LK20_00055 [Oryctes rhinoceros nudivirus]